MIKLMLNVKFSNSKVNLSYKPLRVQILAKNNNEDEAQLISLKEAIELSKKEGVTLQTESAAKEWWAYAIPTLKESINFGRTADINREIKALSEDDNNWLTRLAIWDKHTPVKWNKSGIKAGRN